ncbi:MAG TPA: T9SS type A sorting domain-containing protein [Flavobacteriales bacterium]|nr:T9SS type A sorting domain-containing protein [Flavobacteriales bacterium]
MTTALSQWFYEEYALGVLQIPKTNSLNVFPVPSDGEVTLTWERAGAPMKQVRVFDDLGRSIVSRSGLAGTSIMLDLRGNAPGHYVIEVTDGSQVERRTILLR